MSSSKNPTAAYVTPYRKVKDRIDGAFLRGRRQGHREGALEALNRILADIDNLIGAEERNVANLTARRDRLMVARDAQRVGLLLPDAMLSKL